MRFILLATSALFALITFLMIGGAKSAIHEILAAVCALTSVCAFGMAGIIEAIVRTTDHRPPG